MKNILIAAVIIIIIVVGAVLLLHQPASPEPADQSTVSTASSTAFSLTSSAFPEGGSIPTLYTCEGSSINPPLTLSNVPSGTQSFAITMYDPDVPTAVVPAGFFNHWVVFNIPATTDSTGSPQATKIEASSTIGTSGNNGANAPSYTGPCPPTQYEPKQHRYIFTAYALDTNLALKKGATRDQVEAAVQGHILGQSQLTGVYQKINP